MILKRCMRNSRDNLDNIPEWKLWNPEGTAKTIVAKMLEGHEKYIRFTIQRKKMKKN